MKFFLLSQNTLNAVQKLSAVMSDERHGFEGILLTDIYEPSDGGGTLDAWVALGYLARVVKGAMLGTYVTPIPLRHPVALAKMVSTVDVLSEGRCILGVGAGNPRLNWHKYFPMEPDGVRVSRTREALELITKLWSEDKVTFRGRYYSTEDAALRPKPVSKPRPLFIFGGGGDRMLRLAGRHGDICGPPLFRAKTLEQYLEAKRIVLEAARAANREVEFAYRGFEAEPGQRYPDTGPLNTRLEEAVKAEAQHFLIRLPDQYLEEAVKRFSSEVISSYR